MVIFFVIKNIIYIILNNNRKTLYKNYSIGMYFYKFLFESYNYKIIIRAWVYLIDEPRIYFNDQQLLI